jgi:acetyltransferase-like isoleucine patch superfamily enzyme
MIAERKAHTTAKWTRAPSRAWRAWNDTALGLVFRAITRTQGVKLGRAVRVIGRPIVEVASGSYIKVGDRCVMISRSRSTALGVSRPVILRTLREGAQIDIGPDVGLSGTTICAAKHVSVGNRVLFGADVLVTDTDFHEIDAIPRRYAAPPMPNEADRVVIGDDVFIGARSLILSGSTIGEGSVIGAGSVLKGEIPPRVVAAGNPCRVIRPLSRRES